MKKTFINNVKKCKCQEWARMMFAGDYETVCHPNCEHYDPDKIIVNKLSYEGVARFTNQPIYEMIDGETWERLEMSRKDYESIPKELKF